MRQIPKKLWGEVFDLVTQILRYNEVGDAPRAAEALAELRALSAHQDSVGRPDPFITEALADYTDDAAEAARLYRMAIAQSASYPDEPTHTKRIGLASRLIELGDLGGARVELTEGRADAERLKDAEYIDLADELLSQVAI